MNPRIDLQQEIDKIKRDIALTDIQTIAKDIIFSKQLFEFRDHPRKNLTRILAENLRILILQMQQADGSLTKDPEKKLQVFYDYYKELYRDEPGTKGAVDDNFLDTTELLQISEEDRVFGFSYSIARHHDSY